MKRKHMIALFSILLVLVWMNCSKKSSPAGPNQEKEMPSVSIQTFTIPQHLQQSSDGNAQIAANFMRMANGFSAFSYAFTPPSGLAKAATSLDDPTWRRTWTYDGLTMTLSVYDRGEQYVWKTRLDGKNENFTYTNWLFMKIEESKDGKSGTMTIYKPVTIDIENQWSWGKEANNAYTVIYLENEENGNSNQLKVTQNPDLSGSLINKITLNGEFVPDYESEWTKEGTGTWKRYENGQLVESGSWN